MLAVTNAFETAPTRQRVAIETEDAQKAALSSQYKTPGRSNTMTQFSRRSLIAGSLGAGLALPSMARAIEGCGEQPNTAPALQPPRLLTDWAWLGRYRQANVDLISTGASIDAVLLGDSITEGWASTDPGFFAGANVGRGISAQTTPQLLVRMHADVIALKPRVVHIMAGTNDIAQNTGPMLPEESKDRKST